MKIRRIKVAKAALAKMPRQDRDFLILAGHIQNEINSLNKVFTWCLNNTNEPSPIEATAKGVQALIYARLLAGKLNEAWEVLGKAWFATKLSLKMEPKLHPQAKEARVQLGVYFGRTNLINLVRNSVAFHYSAEGVGAAWEEVADEFETILGGTVGNNLHHGSELAANAALMKAVNPTDLEEGLATFLNEVQSTARYFTDFLDGVLLLMLQDVLGPDFRNAGIYAEIFPPHFRDVHVPFFCLPDLSAGNSTRDDIEP